MLTCYYDKYTIAIEETIVKEFEVFADNTAVAMRIAEKKYKEGDFILNPGEVQFTQMSVVNPSDETTEWCEF